LVAGALAWEAVAVTLVVVAFLGRAEPQAPTSGTVTQVLERFMNPPESHLTTSGIILLVLGAVAACIGVALLLLAVAFRRVALRREYELAQR
jgi:hypothetical protein